MNTQKQATSRNKFIAYWVTTMLVALNLGAGAIIDIMQIPYIQKMNIHLGYPEYFSFILGGWEILGMVVLLIPGFPRLKEWAYAGAFFLFTGAVISRLAVNDDVKEMILPSVFSLITIMSWAYRPPSRIIGHPVIPLKRISYEK